MPNIYYADSLADTSAIGQSLAQQIKFPACVYLNGEMGAGKTTLAKSIIAAYGYEGDVTSPTYNLIQEYQLEHGTIYHMDLYRLKDPEELEFLAIDDLWGPRSLFLIEWPERGFGRLQAADWVINVGKNKLDSDQSREIQLTHGAAKS